MKDSKAMEEIRKIRDNNSAKHLTQSPEERSNEFAASVDWFVSALGKDAGKIKTVGL